MVIVGNTMIVSFVWNNRFKTRESAWKMIDNSVAHLPRRVIKTKTDNLLLLDYADGGFSNSFEIREIEDNPFVVIQTSFRGEKKRLDEKLWENSFGSLKDAKTAIQHYGKENGYGYPLEFEIEPWGDFGTRFGDREERFGIRYISPNKTDSVVTED